jgi:hypothetical protein
LQHNKKLYQTMIVFVYAEVGGIGDRVAGMMTSLLVAMRARLPWKIADYCGQLLEAFDVEPCVLWTGRVPSPVPHDKTACVWLRTMEDVMRVVAMPEASHPEEPVFVVCHVAMWTRQPIPDVTAQEVQKVVGNLKRWVFGRPSTALKALLPACWPDCSLQARFGDETLMQGRTVSTEDLTAHVDFARSLSTTAFVTSDSSQFQKLCSASGFNVHCLDPVHTVAHACHGHTPDAAQRLQTVADFVTLMNTRQKLRHSTSNFGFVACWFSGPLCQCCAPWPTRLLTAGKGHPGPLPVPFPGQGMRPWLHLGCGKKRLPAWVNIDADPSVEPDIVDDIAVLASVPDNDAERIYACHVLEHFGRNVVRDVLATWYRKLAPGGGLRVAVPDFGAVVRRYTATGGNIAEVLGLVCGGQRTPLDMHYVIFDEASLTEALTASGFVDVRQWDWRWADHGHLDDYSQAYLPHMDKAGGMLMSLNLEARKP